MQNSQAVSICRRRGSLHSVSQYSTGSGKPGRNLTSPDFGRITNTLNDGRAFKFTLQLDF